MSDMNESTTNQSSASDEITINFAEIWKSITKYRLSILLVTLFFTAAAAFYRLRSIVNMSPK